MTQALLDVSRWEPVPLTEALDRYDRNLDHLKRDRSKEGVRRAPKQSGWHNDGRLSPAEVYCYLKARFGDPNGPIMLLRTPDSDNLIHWHYSLKVEDDQLEIFGISSRLEFIATAALSPEDWNTLVSNLKTDFANHGSAIKNVRAELEKWMLFVNPFRRLDRILDRFAERLEALDIGSISLPDLPSTQEGAQEFSDRMAEISDRVLEASSLGAAIRMLTPVFGEAFVNLVIFLLAKPEIKSDTRLYSDLLRREIDVRIKILHLNCIGFKTPVDEKREEFRKFLAVMNRRNDFLHGNIDPKKLIFDEVLFDGSIPLFKKNMSLSEWSVNPQLKHVEPEIALSELATTGEFIQYLLFCLEEPFRLQVEMFMEDSFPGWNEITGRPGILFPATAADIVTF